MNFGSHVQGSTSPLQSLMLSNNSGNAISITDVSLSGIHPGDFAHNFGGTVNVADGNSYGIDLTFSPTIWGLRVAQLVITHTGANSPLTISLRGDGTEDCNPWTELANALDTRLESAMEIVDDRMYVFASYIDNGGPNVVINGLSEMYNPFTDTWTRIATMPNPVGHAGSTVDGNDIWIVGGFEEWPRINTTDVQIYNTVSGTWRMGPSLPESRNTAGVELLGNKIYVFGGFRFDPNDFTDEEDIPETLVLDLDNQAAGWQAFADMPEPRNHMGGAVVAGKIYVLGGQQNHNVGGNDIPYVHEYDPVTDVWTQRASIPFAFSHNEPATFTYAGQIIIAGGRTFGSAGLDRVMSYDPFTDTWTQICNLPIVLAGAEAGVMDDKLFLAHGISAYSGDLLDSVFSKTFTNSSPSQMGFYPNEVNLGITQGDNESGEIILYTLQDVANYSIDPASVPFWMTINKNLSGQANINGADVEYTIYTGGLPGGSYTANLVATAPGFPDAIVQISLFVNTNTFPIELLSFEAELYQTKAHLSWQTATEVNSSHFIIERKHSASELFEAIGQVASAGNSTEVLKYSFQEDVSQLPKGRLYYRLKMVDLDGSFSYSNVTSLQFQPNLVQLTAFPNPNDGQFQLDISVPERQKTKLQILDSQGVEVLSQQMNLEKGMNRIDLRLRELATGIYLVRLQTKEGNNYVERMVVR